MPPTGSAAAAIMRCEVLETVWSEPQSPCEENGNYGGNCDDQDDCDADDREAHLAIADKTEAFFAALDNLLLNKSNNNGDSLEVDPDQLFLLPDRVLAVDSLTFREEIAAVAPAFLSPVTPTGGSQAMSQFGARPFNDPVKDNNMKNTQLDELLDKNTLEGPVGVKGEEVEPAYGSSLYSTTGSFRSSVCLFDDTEGLIITRACNGCLWLCKCLELAMYIGSFASNMIRHGWGCSRVLKRI